MSTKIVPNLPQRVLPALLEQWNQLVTNLRSLGVFAHERGAIATELESTADSTDGPTAIVLTNSLRAKYVAHITRTDLHKAADATNTVTAPVATDTATAITLANELKTDFNAHHDSATFHHIPTGTAAGPITVVLTDIATANATDAATLSVLANALKNAHNLHVSSGAAFLSVTKN